MYWTQNVRIAFQCATYRFFRTDYWWHSVWWIVVVNGRREVILIVNHHIDGLHIALGLFIEYYIYSNITVDSKYLSTTYEVICCYGSTFLCGGFKWQIPCSRMFIIHTSTISNQKIFPQYSLVLLNHLLQNYKIILKNYFFSTTYMVICLVYIDSL